MEEIKKPKRYELPSGLQVFDIWKLIFTRAQYQAVMIANVIKYLIRFPLN